MSMMTIAEMFEAIQALCDGYGDVVIHRSCPAPGGQHWYVSSPIEISDGFICRTGTKFTNNLEDAVRLYWQEITDLKPGSHLVVSGRRNPVRVRWNGYMWKQIHIPSESL